MLGPRQVIVFQGRAGDRATGNIPGAQRLALALSADWALPLKQIGQPQPPCRDDWKSALSAARSELLELADVVAAEREAGHFPLCVLPTDAASLAVHPAAIGGDRDVSMVWFDAHADFNTPSTTVSGFLGGMALAGSCGVWEAGFGQAVIPEQVLLIGARAIDAAEERQLRACNIRRIGTAGALEALRATPIKSKVFIHLDLDCLEPGPVPLQYEEPNGLTPEVVRDCISSLCARAEIVGLSISEYFDRQGHDHIRGLQTVMAILSPLSLTGRS